MSPFHHLPLTLLATVALATPFPEESATITGLRTWAFPGGDADVFSLVVFVDAGARDEPLDRLGLAHAVEHCLFRSTEVRDTPQLLDRLRDATHDYNGFTFHDETAYVFDAPPDRWSEVVELVGEMLTRPAFDDADLRDELEIIAEELITGAPDTGTTTVESFLHPHHPLGRPIGGTPEGVKRIRRADLVDFHRHHYRADTIVVAHSGSGAPGEVRRAVERAFSALPSSGRASLREPPDAWVGRKPVGSGATGALVTGFHVRERTPASLASHLVLAAVLEEWLFDRTRTDRALAYSASVRVHAYSDAWRLEVYTGASHDKIEELTAVVGDSVSELADLAAADVDRARQRVVDDLRVQRALELLKTVRWTVRVAQAGGSPPDLRRELERLTRETVAEHARRELVDGDRYVLSSDRDVARPSPPIIPLLIIAVAVFLAIDYSTRSHLTARFLRRVFRRDRT